MGNVLVHVEITPEILSGVSDAARLLGQYEGQHCGLNPRIKRDNFIANLQGNLALEGSTLSVSQIGAIGRGETVGALAHERARATAFLSAYDRSEQFSVANKKDLLTAFLLMNEGRSMNSPKRDVTAASWNARMKESLELINVLLRYIAEDKVAHPIVKASVFHFQMHHIRPFAEANDAVARLWHRLLLGRYHRVFVHAPFEQILKQNQQAYVTALGDGNTHEHQQRFVTFCLKLIGQSLKDVLESLEPRHQRMDDRLTFAKMHFGSGRLTRKAYMELFQTIGPATASRDLKAGLDSGMLKKKGEKARTEYYFSQ